MVSPAQAAWRESPPAGMVEAGGAPHLWYRIFLTDGQVLSIVGDFTRLDDVVMVQVPVSVPGAADIPEARTVTIAATAVDWVRTDAYRDALRRVQMDRSSGERAYAAFTEDVAATLRDVALLPDPLQRIRRLELARAELARWPAAHHGYRADEVAETLSVVDDLLNGMRAAAGQGTFSLTLSTASGPSLPESPPLLPPPTRQEIVTQALQLLPRVSDAGQRSLLLQSAEALLRSAPEADRRWARPALGQVRRQIRTEQGVTRRYERLRAWMLDASTRLLAMADVRGLMRLRTQLVTRDTKLQGQRPEEVASLLATLDTRLERARRQRLLLERWRDREPALKAYASTLMPHLVATSALPRALEDVKALSGPGAALMARADVQLAAAVDDARRAAVPDEARLPHQMWLSAQGLAGRALLTRRAAIRSGDLQQAWEASAAAAGALMLLQQLRSDVPGLLRPPTLPASATP